MILNVPIKALTIFKAEMCNRGIKATITITVTFIKKLRLRLDFLKTKKGYNYPIDYIIELLFKKIFGIFTKFFDILSLKIKN